ncbi:MAG: hypothetical protein KC493_05105 [Bacteriovoracaceae bacterium]|nr:hypothetical protein [Bacteriovoracaceae bacterium]
MSDDKDNKIGDVIKKVVSIGVGAAFMTEDAVKTVLNDLPLPKDIVNGLLQNAKSAKTDFAEGVREEVGKYLSKVDPKTLLDEMLQNYDVEVNAKFSFSKKEEGNKVTKKNG